MRDPVGSKLDVLHVVESYASGVRTAVDDYVRNTPEVRHGLLYATQVDAPLVDADFGRYVWHRRMPSGHVARLRAVRSAVADLEPPVVHAHSSYGGAYARLGVSRRARRIVYTPHCYAFERGDLNPALRTVYRAVEILLRSNTTVTAACSPREMALSGTPRRGRDVVYVPNVRPPGGEPEGRQIAGAERRHDLVGSGRSGTQKDPQFFAACVRALRAAGHDVSALWIGGDEQLRAQLAPSGVDVTGWVPRASAVELVSGARAYLHSARWEGFPLAVLEAVAQGTPAVVRPIPSFDGFDLPLVVATPAEFVDLWDQLGDAAAVRRVMRRLHDTFAVNTDEVQAAVLGQLYGTGARTW